MSYQPHLLFTLALAAACASAPTEPADQSPAAPSAAVAVQAPREANATEAAAADGNAAAQEAAASAPAAPGTAEITGALAFWRAPDFQQRFADSLVAESDFEPKVTADDRDLLLEVSEAMSKATADDATQALDRSISRLRSGITGASSPSVHFMLGSLLLQRERYADAAASYQAAVDKHPTFRRAWKNLGLTQMRLGNHRAAAVALTATVRLGGADALTYGLLGFTHGNDDDHIAAEAAYRMASLLDPTTLDWRLGLARSYFKQRRYADAAALCGTLIGKYPDRADLWVLQANAYLGMNEVRKAAENFEFVDRLGQSTADSLSLLGDVYVNEDLSDLAATAYLRAMAKDTQGRPDRALRAAKALAMRGAHADCQRLIDGIDKTYAGRLDDTAKKEVLKLRARIVAAAGAGDEEARVLEQIVQLDPLDGEAMILLGQYHERRGEMDRAILQYERAAGIAASEADARLRHGQLLVRQGNYAEALPLLRRAQQIKPRDSVQQYVDKIERLAQGKA